MEMSEADLIWNRACMPDNPAVQPGERHLSNLMNVHGMVCNGGVTHAALMRTISEISAASEGARYLGLDELAAALDGIAQISTLEAADEFEQSGLLIDRVEQAYENAVPNDGVIDAAFRNKLRVVPEDF